MVTKAPAQVRGTVVSGGLSWFRSLHGEESLQRVLSRLTPQDRTLFSKSIPAVGWYPVAAFERLIDGFFEEAHARTGITREEFDRKGSEDSGSLIASTVYRVLLSLLGPVSFLPKAAILRNRLYDQSTLSVVENRYGHAKILLSGSSEMRIHDLRALYSLRHGLAQTGVRNVKTRILRENRNANGYVIELEVTYE